MPPGRLDYGIDISADLEKESNLSVFHAIQSISIYGSFVCSLPHIHVHSGHWLDRRHLARAFGMFVLWIVLMYKAYQGEKFNYPL